MGAVLLLAMLGGDVAAAQPSAPCDVRLTVELSPDVPNPPRRNLGGHVVRVALPNAFETTQRNFAP